MKVFNTKFKSIFDDKKCQGSKLDKDIIYKARDEKLKLPNNKFKIYDFDILSAIKEINNCLGCDGLHANHFKFCANGVKLFLSRLFSSFLCHGYIPNDMLKGEIRDFPNDVCHLLIGQ